MLGIICEKPSAARNFAKALGGTWDKDHYQGSYQGEKYKICALAGHLYQLNQPEEMGGIKYKAWNLTNLPWDYADFNFSYSETDSKYAKQAIKTAKRVLKACDEIVIATDNDPSGEGQLLAWEFLINAKVSVKSLSRMYFADESPKSIQTAFINREVNPTVDNDLIYRKALYRQRWDFMSMQFTRIASVLASKPGIALRQGRLKSPMVLLVGEQLKAREEYEKNKKPFYQNRFKDENGVAYNDPKQKEYPNKEDVPTGLKESEVILDKKENKSTPPPKYLDLAGLAARLAPLGLKAKTVQELYQKMYEDSILSYPRTEDKFISLEQFNELLPKVDNIARLVGVNPSILTQRTPRKTHVKEGGTHGANRPGSVLPESLAELDDKYGSGASLIYRTLATNYLASLAPDYVYEHQSGHLKDYPEYIGSTNVPVSLGWKDITGGYKPGEDESAGLGRVAKPFIYEGYPKAPQAPSQKWLMEQLEKRDIGTGATRTSTFADVSDKSDSALILANKGKLELTELGWSSYYILQNTHIGDLDLTKQVQEDMNAVQSGKLDLTNLNRIQQLVVEDLKTMSDNAKNHNLNSSNADYVLAEFKGKEIRFKRTFSGHTFSDEELERLLNGEEISISAVSKAGKTYNTTGKLAKQEYQGRTFWGFKTNITQARDVGLCPCCKKGQVKCYGSRYACGCGFSFFSPVAKHNLNEEEIESLLKKGRTPLMDNLVAKSGKTFSAYLKINKKKKTTEYEFPKIQEGGYY